MNFMYRILYILNINLEMRKTMEAIKYNAARQNIAMFMEEVVNNFV